MDKFVIIPWPESQAYMDMKGFAENSCLINDEPFLSEYGSSAYFVRESWLHPDDPINGLRNIIDVVDLEDE